MKSIIVSSVLALVIAAGAVAPASALVVGIGVGPRGARVGLGHPYRRGYAYRRGFARPGLVVRPGVVVHPLLPRRAPVVIIH